MSVCTRPMDAETIAVNAPITATISSTCGACENSIALRHSRYTPAVTMVAAWISADTGVGPSIASGSQTNNGICADLPVAPTNSSRHAAESVANVVVSTGMCATASRTTAKSTEPVVVKTSSTPSRNPQSPMRLTMKAFRPAFDALSFRYRSPISR